MGISNVARTVKREKRKRIPVKLVCRAQRGDEDAIEAVLERCEPIVRRVARPKGAPGHFDGRFQPVEIEEREQAARIAIWEKAIEKFDLDRAEETGAEFKTVAYWWARSQVRLYVRGRIRRRKRFPLAEDCDLGMVDDERRSVDPLDNLRRLQERDVGEHLHSVEMEDERALVRARIAQLPELWQRVIFYRFWEQRTVREIERMSREEPERWGLEPMSRQTVIDIQVKACEQLRSLYVETESPGERRARWDSDESSEQEPRRRSERLRVGTTTRHGLVDERRRSGKPKPSKKRTRSRSRDDAGPSAVPGLRIKRLSAGQSWPNDSSRARIVSQS